MYLEINPNEISHPSRIVKLDYPLQAAEYFRAYEQEVRSQCSHSFIYSFIHNISRGEACLDMEGNTEINGDAACEEQPFTCTNSHEAWWRVPGSMKHPDQVLKEFQRKKPHKCFLGQVGPRGDWKIPLFSLAKYTERRLIKFYLGCLGTLGILFNLCKHWFLHL